MGRFLITFSTETDIW